MKKLFVMIAAVAFVVAFTAPAFAAEWSFYGSARISSFWADVSEELGPTGDDDSGLADGHAFDIQGNSRIGANVKVSDNLTGRFEYGATPNLRLLWGEYDFGGWKLGVGQNYVPLCMFYSNSAFGPDNNFLDVGGVYVGRDPMVQAKIGGLSVALVKPNVSVVKPATPAGILTIATEDVEDDDVVLDVVGDDSVVYRGPSGYYEDTDVTLPQIQAKYTFKVAGLSLAVAGGYQTYDVVTAADKSDDVTAYMVAIGASYNMGPLYIGADYWMGQNTGNIGQATFGYAPDISASADADGVLDNDSYGFLAVVGFTLSDMLYFEGGYGFASGDLDGAAKKDETSGYYVQAQISLAKGVLLVPEIGHYDLKKDFDGDDEGDVTYYGLKWQISF